MDKERRNSIDHAVRVLAGVIRSIHLKRVLHKVDAKPRLNFWCIIYGNLLDAAVLDWCMLFGSHNQKHQPLHWKNVVPQLEHNTFRDGLLCHLNVDCDHWHYYREQVKGYRDNHAAHFGMDWNRPENNPLYPDLELALQAAYYYYEKLIEILDNAQFTHNYPKDINEYCERFVTQMAEVATRAVVATATMVEIVW